MLLPHFLILGSCPPAVATETGLESDGDKGLMLVNVAETLIADVMDTVQLPVPLHEPPQPPKLHPESGVAVKLTDVPFV